MEQNDKWWKKCKTFNYIVVGNGCCILRREEDLIDDILACDEYILNKVDNPLEANLLIIQGPINRLMLNVLMEVYKHMLMPKLAILFGDCTKGKIFDQQIVTDELLKYIKIDYHLPGCPPEKSSITKCLDQ